MTNRKKTGKSRNIFEGPNPDRSRGTNIFNAPHNTGNIFEGAPTKTNDFSGKKHKFTLP
jgi:hypothetical protein